MPPKLVGVHSKVAHDHLVVGSLDLPELFKKTSKGNMGGLPIEAQPKSGGGVRYGWKKSTKR